MPRRKSDDGDRVRRAIGPSYTDLLCPSCCNKSANGMIAVNGGLYVSCGLCRWKCFGLTPRSISGFRWILKMLEKDGMLERLIAAQGQGVVTPEQLAPAVAPAPAQAPVEARGEAGVA